VPRRLQPRIAAYCALLALGCHETTASKDTGAHPPATARSAAPRASTRRPTVHFEGACDASGAVPLDAHRFAVADDEDSVLRIYDAERGGAPLYTVDVSRELGLAEKQRKKKPKPKRESKRRKPPETDIEAATAIGERAYWITSHARTKSGKRDPARFKFFATLLPTRENAQAIGTPYTALVDDMLSDPRLARLGLDRAVEVPPAEGGLNVEGLSATPDGKLLIGLRQPVSEGKAIVLTLENADGVVHGAKAKFGAPVLLDLGGLGVRALSWWHGSYLVVAGSGSTGPASRLYRWDGSTTPQQLSGVSFADLNPEGFFTPEARTEILVLSDDGTRLVGGEPCKELKNVEQKRFRGLWLDLTRP
jgi:hypothetical protein